MSELTLEQALRYSRQISLSNFDLDRQERLLSSKVLVIGLGGLGCAAAQYLTASGVGHLTLIDDDVVERSNLQRQVLHTEQRVGMLKVESAAEALRQLNSQLTLTILDTRQTKKALQKLIYEHDLVVDCTDNLDTRNLLNTLSYHSGKPLVSGAAIRMEGHVFCVLPARNSACYRCFSHFFGEQQLSCVESGILSPVVGIVGATQALEAIKILTDYGNVPENHLHVFDAMHSQWQVFKVKPWDKCPVCVGSEPK